MTPKSVSSITTWIVEFFAWWDVACEICFYATFAVLCQLNSTIRVVKCVGTLAIRIVDFLVQIYDHTHRLPHYSKTYHQQWIFRIIPIESIQADDSEFIRYNLNREISSSFKCM